MQEASLDSLRQRIKVQFDLKQYDLLIDIAKRGLEIDPNDPCALYYLGQTYRRLERYSEALDISGRLLAVDSEDPDYYSLKAGILESLEKYEEAITYYEKAIELNPHNESYYRGIAHNASLLADPKFQEKVVPMMRKAIRLGPNNAHNHGFFAILLMNRGLYAEARKEFEISIELAPNESINHSSYGDFLYYTGDLKEAKTYTMQALKINPMDPTAERNLSLLEQAERDPQHYIAHRIETYSGIIQFYPQHDEPYRHLAKLLLEINDKAEAQRVVRAFARARPDADDEEIRQLMAGAGGAIPSKTRRFQMWAAGMLLIVVVVFYFVFKQ
ncbi:tetratricopeptide repeat protein [Paenibacillus sp.]|uniref:tetratricopeptide repeat protein n=1 Tax=Paenibacillus sp. TaxID=58172 RepID=UPI0028360757|nr:tetratricopeptide repeat protein [Paenibacillus sp.]MDR0271649.1 tetratricopeptide repeat protein [Paenibacillus sp.]